MNDSQVISILFSLEKGYYIWSIWVYVELLNYLLYYLDKIEGTNLKDKSI